MIPACTFMTLDESLSLIENADYLRLSVTYEDIPYTVPMFFAHDYVASEDKLTVYLASLPRGYKLSSVGLNPYVCLEWDRHVGINQSGEDIYESVLGFGTLYNIFDNVERGYALRQIYGNETDTVNAVRAMKVIIRNLNGRRFTVFK